MKPRLSPPVTQRRPQKGQAATDPRVHGGTREGSGGRSRGSAAGFSGLHPAWVYLPAPDRRRRLCSPPDPSNARSWRDSSKHNSAKPSSDPAVVRPCRPAPAPIRGSFRATPRQRSDPRGRFPPVTPNPPPLWPRGVQDGYGCSPLQGSCWHAGVPGRPTARQCGGIFGPAPCLGMFASPRSPPPAVVGGAAPPDPSNATSPPRSPPATVSASAPPPRNLLRCRPAPAPIRGSFRAPPRQRSDPRGQFRAAPLLSRCGGRGFRETWGETAAAGRGLPPAEAPGGPISQG